MLSLQTIWPSPHAERIRRTIERLREQRVVARVWERDASLWSQDPGAQAAIRNRLGWLTIADVMARRIGPVQGLARELRAAGFSRTLVLGMGGSGLFAEVVRRTFGAAPGHLELAVLDTTDPTAIRAHQQRGPLEALCVIVSSKSGTTTEVVALMTYFYEAFRTISATAGAHCLAITDEGTPLARQAAARGFRRVFAHGPGAGAEVGGRFSALTYFGLVPAAVMGVDITRLLERAQQMAVRCGPEASAEDHPALCLGAALGTLAVGGQDKLTLLCAPELDSFGTWVEQLIAESLGKQGKGIVPIHGEPVRPPAAYAPDRLFVELQPAAQPDRALAARVEALAAAGHPVIRLGWEDGYDLGGSVTVWTMATAIAGHLLGVNPFDEPSVQESKDRTAALLSRYQAQGRFDEEPPCCTNGQVAIYGGPVAAAGTRSGPAQAEAARSAEAIPADAGPRRRDASLVSSPLAGCLGEFFRDLQPGEYVAVLSFLPRTPNLDQAAGTLRERIGSRWGCATMLGIGPRYLHSTGQLYKGGKANGLFLLLTAEEPEDLPIPGQPWTFGVLKQAQALGDVEAMRDHGRRLLRLHVRGNLDQAVRQVVAAVDDA
jgi:glucose-6-phosphate isomerase